MSTHPLWLVVITTLSVSLLGCSGGSATSTGSPSVTAAPTTAVSTPTAITNTATTSTRGSTPGSTPAPTSASVTASAAVLADGRHPAYIRSVDVTHRRIVVDVVQLFTGKAAASAAAADHSSEVPPPNDYWIRNTSAALRTLNVTADASVTVNVLGAEESGSATQNIRWSLAKLAAAKQLKDSLFWVTVSHGRVTRIAEQYLP